MFSSDHNISSLKDLIAEIKAYISMRYDLAKLDFISKFTILAATLFLSVLITFLLGVSLLFLSFGVAKSIASFFGNDSLAFILIALFYFIAALVVYLFRKPLIIKPVAKFLIELFISPNNKEEERK